MPSSGNDANPPIKSWDAGLVGTEGLVSHLRCVSGELLTWIQSPALKDQEVTSGQPSWGAVFSALSLLHKHWWSSGAVCVCQIIDRATASSLHSASFISLLLLKFWSSILCAVVHLSKSLIHNPPHFSLSPANPFALWTSCRSSCRISSLFPSSCCSWLAAQPHT